MGKKKVLDELKIKTDEELKKDIKKLLQETRKQIKAEKTNPSKKPKNSFFDNNDIIMPVTQNKKEKEMERMGCDGDCENCDIDHEQIDLSSEINPQLDIITDFEKAFKEEKSRIEKYNPEELADWIIRKHEAYIKAIEENTTAPKNFLLDCSDAARVYIFGYIRDIFIILVSYNCNVTSQTIEILKKKGYKKLVNILETLNFGNNK